MPDPLIIGEQLTTLRETQGSPQVNKQSYGNDPANPLTATECIRTYVIRRDLAVGALPAMDSTDVEFNDCLLKQIVIEAGDTVACTVKCYFRTPEFQSYVIDIRPGDTMLELDIGVIQAPVEMAAYFSTLTQSDLENVNLKLGNPSSGGTLSGRALELYIMKLKGVEVFDIACPIFRKTSAWSSVGFNFGNVNKREYPGFGIPGSANNWHKTAYRRNERRTASGTYYETCEEWLYSADTWDARLYP